MVVEVLEVVVMGWVGDGDGGVVWMGVGWRRWKEGGVNTGYT